MYKIPPGGGGGSIASSRPIQGAFPPLIKLILLHSAVVTLHTSYTIGMLDLRGEGCQNTTKQIIIKAH